MRKPRSEHMLAGLPSIADIARRAWHGRKVPQAAVSRCGKVPLFDHLAGAGEQLGWNIDLEGFRGLPVDHQLELGCTIDWQISWLGAFEDPADLDPRATISVDDVVAVANQTASEWKFTVGRHHRNVGSCCQNDKLNGADGEERIACRNSSARFHLC